jgi:hypothetical protein
VSRNGPIVAQFRYARFTLEDDNRDVALMEGVDQALCITFNQFRALAKHQGGAVDLLASFVKGEMDEPKRTTERILKTGPVETVIPYTCLIELYQKATAKPAEGKPTDKGYCAVARQKFASNACRKRAARRVA